MVAIGDAYLGRASAEMQVTLLRQSLEEASKKFEAAGVSADRQTRMMVKLTWAIAVMTLVMTIGVCVQIWFAME